MTKREPQLDHGKLENKQDVNNCYAITRNNNFVAECKPPCDVLYVFWIETATRTLPRDILGEVYFVNRFVTSASKVYTFIHNYKEKENIQKLKEDMLAMVQIRQAIAHRNIEEYKTTLINETEIKISKGRMAEELMYKNRKRIRHKGTQR